MANGRDNDFDSPDNALPILSYEVTHRREDFNITDEISHRFAAGPLKKFLKDIPDAAELTLYRRHDTHSVAIEARWAEAKLV